MYNTNGCRALHHLTVCDPLEDTHIRHTCIAAAKPLQPNAETCGIDKTPPPPLRPYISQCNKQGMPPIIKRALLRISSSYSCWLRALAHTILLE
jgi:hypothetical protein